MPDAECAQNRQCLFGDIADGKMVLNKYGKIVADEWKKTAEIRREIELDEWIVMPNHFHAIVVMTDPVGAIHELPLQMSQKQRRKMTLPKLISRFKMLSSKHINKLRNTPGTKLWQRNYYEHIICNDDKLHRTRRKTGTSLTIRIYCDKLSEK